MFFFCPKGKITPCIILQRPGYSSTPVGCIHARVVILHSPESIEKYLEMLWGHTYALGLFYITPGGVYLHTYVRNWRFYSAEEN